MFSFYFGLLGVKIVLPNAHSFLKQSVQLERLSVYHDFNSLPWKIEKRWEDLSPKEWIEVCIYLWNHH